MMEQGAVMTVRTIKETNTGTMKSEGQSPPCPIPCSQTDRDKGDKRRDNECRGAMMIEGRVNVWHHSY